jgi:archaeosine synthase beta-subunit
MENSTGKAIRKLMRIVRKDHFSRTDPRPNSREPVIYWEETNVLGKPYLVPLVILRTRPCRWFSSGGCVMCNYELMAIDEGVSDNDVLTQVEFAVKHLGGDLSKYPYILLTSQGSFLDDEEVGAELRNRILRLFWDAGLQAISTESEARYCIDAARIANLKLSFPGQISVGIGLEAADDFIRNSIINKGLPLQKLVDASTMLKISGINFYTYISLGKPFLSIEEDVDDALTAVALSLDLGAIMTVVEMINIQPHTLTEKLWRKDLYAPCSLWLGIELLSRLPVELRQQTSIKGFDADIEPSPLALPKSCSKCDTRLRTAMNEWNFQRSFTDLVRSADTCECRPVIGEIQTDRAMLESRVTEALTELVRN